MAKPKIRKLPVCADLHGNDGEDALERVHATRHKQHVLAPLGCNRNVPVSGVPDPDPDV